MRWRASRPSSAEASPPRATFEQLVRAHLETLLGPGQDFIPVVLYEWRSLEPAARRKIKVLLKRYEAIWQEVIAALQQNGDWPGSTRIDALLLFGALNWIARWYDVRRALDVDALAGECIRFFLRNRCGRRAGKPLARSGGGGRRDASGTRRSHSRLFCMAKTQRLLRLSCARATGNLAQRGISIVVFRILTTVTVDGQD